MEEPEASRVRKLRAGDYKSIIVQMLHIDDDCTQVDSVISNN